MPSDWPSMPRNNTRNMDDGLLSLKMFVSYLIPPPRENTVTSRFRYKRNKALIFFVLLLLLRWGSSPVPLPQMFPSPNNFNTIIKIINQKDKHEKKLPAAHPEVTAQSCSPLVFSLAFDYSKTMQSKFEYTCFSIF